MDNSTAQVRSGLSVLHPTYRQFQDTAIHRRPIQAQPKYSSPISFGGQPSYHKLRPPFDEASATTQDWGGNDTNDMCSFTK
ncbi:hypothetical protein J6590_035569 [Homalodisca vitripennis]|nr:hypothetical protein J6590_035569 [Homalodisca vitripennis]